MKDPIRPRTFSRARQGTQVSAHVDERGRVNVWLQHAAAWRADAKYGVRVFETGLLTPTQQTELLDVLSSAIRYRRKHSSHTRWRTR